MKKIRIEGIEGYYIIENDELIYNYDDDLQCKDECNEVIVEDLTELKVYQYNELAKNLWVYYPDYNINKLKGRFI